MLVRSHSLQRLIAVLLVALVAVSAQAWASHVDWPMSHGNDHAHVDLAALDDAHTLSDAVSAQADSGDHCCHAAAHLVGLGSGAVRVDIDTGSQYRAGRGERYTNPAHLPLTEPPIV